MRVSKCRGRVGVTVTPTVRGYPRCTAQPAADKGGRGVTRHTSALSLPGTAPPGMRAGSTVISTPRSTRDRERAPPERPQALVAPRACVFAPVVLNPALCRPLGCWQAPGKACCDPWHTPPRRRFRGVQGRRLYGARGGGRGGDWTAGGVDRREPVSEGMYAGT